MFSSVRVRLTLWYTAVMAAVLVVLALVTYFILQKNAMRRTDAAVVEQADSFLNTVEAEMRGASGAENLQQGLDAAISEHKFRDTLFIVVDESGHILASSENSVPQGRSDDAAQESLQDSVHRITGDKRPFETVRVGRRAYRSYVRNFSVERKDGVLVVLQSLHPQEEFLETLTGTFGLVIPLALILAASGGYLLAWRSLSPVAAMGMQAGHIGADNLHERLSVRNPKDELGQLAGSFNSLLDRLDLSFEQQRRFVADASHELRTPVAILCGEADVALFQPSRSPEEYRESLTILGAEARRLKHIVEDLFTLARADAGQHPLMLTDFYLDELVAECARNMRTLAAAKQIVLRCEVPGEMPIHADESLLRRMVLNLLDNAIKYTPCAGEVLMSCGERNSLYTVTIRDTGVGIPGDLQPRIFERFFRADAVRTRSESNGGGAGLGLSISRWIAEAHDGRLELTGSSANGSTFTMFLPKTSVPPLIPRLSSDR
jgi:heavy metal sensor kinase